MPYGSGSTNVFGTPGDDVLSGDKGVNFINGGAGDDTLSGGAGADVFWGSAIGLGDDLVLDFKAAGPQHDVLVFDGFGDLQMGHARLSDGQTFTTSTGHVLTIVDDGGDVVLSWDTGDSVTLAGVDPRDLFADLIVTQGHPYGPF